MVKINFIAPYARKPAGGISAIYALSAQLNQKFDTGVWPEYQNRVKAGSNIEKLPAGLSDKAHWVISECQLPYLENTQDIKRQYSIFVQNPYIIFHLKRFSNEKIRNNIINAKYIFCISADSEAVVKSIFPTVTTIRLHWSLDHSILEQSKNIKNIVNGKENLITYMPRKCRQIHSLLQNQNIINGFELRALNGLPFDKLINQMQKSSIFISLSEFEGFAAPPVEAYALGNIVVGYTGNGNEKLFDYKNFHKIEQNNYIKLVEKLHHLTAERIHFSLDQFDILMEKFALSSVSDYNFRKFEKLNFQDMCEIGSNFSYPKNKILYYWDSVKTKFYEI